jgi:hypothetical protein
VLQQACEERRCCRLWPDGNYCSLDVAEEQKEEVGDDEDGPELMQLTEESGVRDLALGDWARLSSKDIGWVLVQSC